MMDGEESEREGVSSFCVFILGHPPITAVVDCEHWVRNASNIPTG